MPLQLLAIVYIDVDFQVPLSLPYSAYLSDPYNSEAGGDRIPVILQVFSHNVRFANPYQVLGFLREEER